MNDFNRLICKKNLDFINKFNGLLIVTFCTNQPKTPIGVITLRYMDTLPHQDVATRAALFSSVTGFIAMVLAALAVVLAGAAFIRKDRRP